MHELSVLGLNAVSKTIRHNPDGTMQYKLKHCLPWRLSLLCNDTPPINPAAQVTPFWMVDNAYYMHNPDTPSRTACSFKVHYTANLNVLVFIYNFKDIPQNVVCVAVCFRQSNLVLFSRHVVIFFSLSLVSF